MKFYRIVDTKTKSTVAFGHQYPDGGAVITIDGGPTRCMTKNKFDLCIGMLAAVGQKIEWVES